MTVHRDNLVYDTKHLVSTFKRLIPLESQFRYPSQFKIRSQFSAEEACGRRQYTQCLQLTFVILFTIPLLQATDIYLGMLHIRGGVYCRNRNEISKSRVFDLAPEHLTDFLTDNTIHPLDVIPHGLLLNQPLPS